MLNKQELLQLGTQKYKAYCEKEYRQMTEKKGLEPNFVTTTLYFHKKPYKAGYRKGLKMMRHTILQALEVYMKSHNINPTMKRELMELLSYKGKSYEQD